MSIYDCSLRYEKKESQDFIDGTMRQEVVPVIYENVMILKKYGRIVHTSSGHNGENRSLSKIQRL